MAGLSRSTWHYRQHPRERVKDPIRQADRAYESRISDADQERISGLILHGWSQQNSVDHSFVTAWDNGIMLASRRTWWRIAAELKDQMLRPKIPARKDRRQSRGKPVVKATGPGQVWSWDITDLYSPWRGKVFKAYKIIDIYSRKVVGWRVENRATRRRRCASGRLRETGKSGCYQDRLADRNGRATGDRCGAIRVARCR